MTSTDPFNLQRFVTAQEDAYPTALAELRRGRKTSHWMWFVFPQVQGLGRSSMAQRYAVVGLDEARAYLAHPVLGARLQECVAALLDVAANEEAAGRRPDAVAVLGSIDATKLRSSMTLFARAAEQDPAEQDAAEQDAAEPFRRVLEAYFNGVEDPATLERL